jgi:hypothetical protein
VARNAAGNDEDKGVAEVVSDLWELVREYAKQETIDPLKNVWRFFGWGLMGSFLLALGFVFLSLGILRGLQVQTGDALTGNLTFVPYLATLVVDSLVVLWAVRAIRKPFRAEEAS